ncbi:MAG: MFS transporter [Dehalococcoidia bacterium]
MQQQARPKLFYGWWITLAGALMQSIVAVLVNQSFGTYAKVLSDEYNWSKTVFSAAFSFSRVETGILGPAEGWLIDRFGPQRIMQVGVVILGAGLMLFSMTTATWMFVSSFALMAFGASLASFMPVSVAIVNWFERRRARALTFLSLGFATGGLLVPVLVYFIENIGWRQTTFGAGILVVIVGIPLSLIIRHRPEPYGMHKDGIVPGSPEDIGETGRPRAKQYDFTAKQAMRTSSFWLIALGHGSALLIVAALQVHLTLHLTENLGYTLGQAASVVAFLTAMQVVGQALTGVVGDRWSKRGIVVVCMGMHAVAIILLAFANSTLMVGAFAVLHGLAWGARGPLMSAIRADFFGGANFGTIMGTSSLIASIGTTIGPLIAGILADMTGSYEVGFTVLAVMAGLGSLFFVFAKPPKFPEAVAADAIEAADDASATPASGH